MATHGSVTELNPDHIMQVGLGFWASKALLSAVELGLFTDLAQEHLNLDSLTKKLALHPRAARDFLDALVALGFLERKNGVYSNTPSADFFLDRRKPSYVGGILEMASLRLYPFWSGLTTALRTGEQQNEAKGGGASLFVALYADPERLKGFLKAMTGISSGANRAIARKFPWQNYKTAADIGTAQGDLIVQVALANPHISGVGFDLPEVKPVFEEYVAAQGLKQRVAFQAGSFFEHALPKADVLMMGHILHDWNLQEKRTLIRKACDVLPSGGALIVYDCIIDDDRCKNAFGLLMSLNMLVETPGGFDYTGADCCAWMKEAGFRETRVEHLVGPDSMVVGIK
ncbi:MAG TPA: methyltransferase [Candidatus Acidoferrales bacterium]|nr:methyltransferase [Candidatus Acidoferrales bacterium]